MSVDPSKFGMVEARDRLELDLPQETLDVIEGLLREVVPSFARYAWFIDAEGWAFVFEGSPPSDRTYLMRCLAAAVCAEGEPVNGFRIHPTPTLAPFEIRLHVQALGPGTPLAVLICQPHEHADLDRMGRALAAIRPRLESIVSGGIWIVPPPVVWRIDSGSPPSRA